MLRPLRSDANIFFVCTAVRDKQRHHRTTWRIRFQIRREMDTPSELKRNRVEINPFIPAGSSETECRLPRMFLCPVNAESRRPARRCPAGKAEFRRIHECAVETALRSAVPEIISGRIQFRFHSDGLTKDFPDRNNTSAFDVKSHGEVSDRRRKDLLKDKDLLPSVGNRRF